MSLKWRGPFPWLAAAFAADAAAVVVAGLVLLDGPLTRESFIALELVALAGAVVLFVVSWKIIEVLVIRSLRRMAAEVRAIAHGAGRSGVDPQRYAIISPLTEAVNEVCARLVRSRAELAAGLSAATRRAEDNAHRLAAILNDLHEGVVVCNQRHHLVLYNQVAFDMLRPTAELGLGRSLFETLSREPVVHMTERLGRRGNAEARGVPFLAGTADGRLLLQARMTLIYAESGGVTGYVVTLVDAAPQLASMIWSEDLLREVAEAVEAPLARIEAAAGADDPIRRDCAAIAEAVRRVTGGYDRMLASWWPMTDIGSTELLRLVGSRLGDEVNATVVGLPVTLHGESYALILVIEALVRRIAARRGVCALDLSAGQDEARAWIDCAWAGAPVAAGDLDRWLDLSLAALGGVTVRDVLGGHAGAVPETRRGDGGGAVVRLPMLPGKAPPTPAFASLPARPEFHDLGLLEQARDTGSLGSRSLKSLSFVVFDTETTGLHPSQGDDIVSIAGVRIVNGRILSGESFSRLVNPGRPIPAESIRFHGITDDMVRDKPPVAVVLPQFHAFVADSVLVAHNAAFDLKFLRRDEAAMGLSFDNPVLDTMILSNYIDGPEAGHSLDALCERYGLDIVNRHTALGDAIVTAAVLLRQIEALEERGIHTLDQAVATLDIIRILHERQRVL